MFKGKRIIAIIPARGGSKGLKDKNILSLDGKPLIAHTILKAKSSEYLDKIFVSTDNEKIAEIGRQWGIDIPLLRPAEFALDNSPSSDAILHALDFLNQTVIFLTISLFLNQLHL
ncbi:MAG: hypothetical protein HC905_23070 [Bacteroidales bacterium]|nr:hypothetical protein [Bacteroidales bacterium]